MGALRTLWGRIVDVARGLASPARSEQDDPDGSAPADPPAERVHVADIHAVAEWPPLDAPAADLSEGEPLRRLESRELKLRERLDAAVKYRLGTEFEVRELAITPGSIAMLIPIFGALGAYGAARSGFDYLVADVRRILGREVRSDAGANPDFDVWVVRREGLVPASAGPAADGGGDKVALWLIGAGAFMTTTLGLIGATGANLERVRINYPVEVSIAFSAVILAILVGVCWPLFREGARLGGRGALALGTVLLGAAVTVAVEPSTDSWLIAVAVGAIVAGLILVVGWPLVQGAAPGKMVPLVVAVLVVGVAVGAIAYWATKSVSAKTRPQITATLMRSEATAKVVGKIRATGLQRREHMLVRVIGLSSRGDLAARRVGHAGSKEGRSKGQLVYGSRTGANSDGEAELAIDVPVAAGLYDRLDVEAELVRDEGQKQADVRAAAQVPLPNVPVATRCGRPTRVVGCLSIFVPPIAGGPRLTATWKLPAGKPPVLEVTARIGDLSSDDRVLLSVRRLKRKRAKLGGRVYSALWAADPAGKVDEKVSLAVNPSRRPLCVIMRTLQGALNYAAPEAAHLGPCGKRSRGVAILVRPPGT